MKISLSSVLQQLGFSPFQCHSCYPLGDAQRNLSGRTHYVDDDTLRFFLARILYTGREHDSLTFWLVESVRSKPDSLPGGRIRFVAFDVFGSVVSRDEWHRSSKAAIKAGRAWLAQHDAVAHTRAALANSLERMQADVGMVRGYLDAVTAVVTP